MRLRRIVWRKGHPTVSEIEVARAILKHWGAEVMLHPRGGWMVAWP